MHKFRKEELEMRLADFAESVKAEFSVPVLIVALDRETAEGLVTFKGVPEADLDILINVANGFKEMVAHENLRRGGRLNWCKFRPDLEGIENWSPPCRWAPI